MAAWGLPGACLGPAWCLPGGQEQCFVDRGFLPVDSKPHPLIMSSACFVKRGHCFVDRSHVLLSTEALFYRHRQCFVDTGNVVSTQAMVCRHKNNVLTTQEHCFVDTSSLVLSTEAVLEAVRTAWATCPGAAWGVLGGPGACLAGQRPCFVATGHVLSTQEHCFVDTSRLVLSTKAVLEAVRTAWAACPGAAWGLPGRPGAYLAGLRAAWPVWKPWTSLAGLF